MQHAPGGDWKRVDWDALAAWLGRYGYKVADCETEALPTADASRRLREWECKGKNASSLNQWVDFQSQCNSLNGSRVSAASATRK